MPNTTGAVLPYANTPMFDRMAYAWLIGILAGIAAPRNPLAPPGVWTGGPHYVLLQVRAKNPQGIVILQGWQMSRFGG